MTVHDVIFPNLATTENPTKAPVSVASSSTVTADQGQDLVDGEEHDVPGELPSEHGIVASATNTRYQLVVGLLPELAEVQPLA